MILNRRILYKVTNLVKAVKVYYDLEKLNYALMSHYPPLKSLVVFNAVAEHKHFSKAAKFLHVTTGAVSQQIKSLESHLDCQLFERDNRLVKITAVGEIYWREIRVALQMISDATEKVKPSDDKVVRLKIMSTLAMQWLIPQLGSFQAQYPDIHLQIMASTDYSPSLGDSADLSVSCFTSPPEFGEAQKLWMDRLVFVYANTLSVNSMEQALRKFPLIAVSQPLRKDDWETFCKAYNLKIKTFFLNFSNTAQAIEAVKAGAGVLVTHYPFVMGYLNDGVLKSYGEPIDTSKYYYLIEHRSIRQSPSVKMVKQWVLAQAALVDF